MIKKCRICSHTGELTWRDGKYHCAMCDSVISENEPEVVPQQKSAPAPQSNTVSGCGTKVNNVTCPICRNKENNLFNGSQYRCSLCGTTFDNAQAPEPPVYTPNSGTNPVPNQRIQELKKQKDNNLILGIVFLFVFWPVSIYFFCKFAQVNKELSLLGVK